MLEQLTTEFDNLKENEKNYKDKVKELEDEVS